VRHQVGSRPIEGALESGAQQHGADARRRHVHGGVVQRREPEKRRRDQHDEREHGDASQRGDVAAHFFDPQGSDGVGQVVGLPHGQQDTSIDVVGRAAGDRG